jgi:primosomal protein N'
VHREPVDRPPHVPAPGEVTIGGAEAVKDFGPVSLNLVGVLDADLALRRPGLSALERSLAVWMEASAWAWPTGRVVVQSNQSKEPVVQSLVAGNPGRFHRSEIERRKEAGFPVGCPVFRVAGTAALHSALEQLAPVTLLRTAAQEETICLIVVTPKGLPAFGRAMRTLAQEGIVTRVEAEPHL